MSTYLIVSAAFLTTGGQDRANHALASYLARRGHRVHLVAHQVDDALLREGDVTWHRAPRPLNSTLLGEPFLQRLGTKVARAMSGDDTRIITNGGNCDCPADANWVHYVHAAYARQPDGAARRLRYRVAHKRFVANERSALARARLVIANSHRTAHNLEMHVNVPRATVHVLYYGTDPAQFHPPVGPLQRVGNTVLFIGALGDRRKGFDTVFRAWNVLCADPAWTLNLAVVGRGADVARWRSRINASGLSHRINLLGFRDDVPDLVRESPALVAPTGYEPYGLGVHEALCCGVPAIVSAGAGVAERYPHELRHLLLTDSEDAEDLARRLRACISMSSDARAALRRFSDDLRSRTWDDMAADIVKLIEDARRSPASQKVLVTIP
jgi:glycosyltransferase involved in cell wall biosynthesis